MSTNSDIGKITQELKDLDQQAKSWIEATLANDESSTDEEMTQYFIENGISEMTAKYLVEVEREFYLSNFRYSLFSGIVPAIQMKGMYELFNQ